MRLALCVLFALVVSSSVVAKDDAQSTVADEVVIAKQGISLLHNNMKDPDSFRVEHVYAKMQHKAGHPLQCIVYRSKNSFGGYVHNVAEYKGGDAMSMGFMCSGIERNLKRALAKDWQDITEECGVSTSSASAAQ